MFSLNSAVNGVVHAMSGGRRESGDDNAPVPEEQVQREENNEENVLKQMNSQQFCFG